MPNKFVVKCRLKILARSGESSKSRRLHTQEGVFVDVAVQTRFYLCACRSIPAMLFQLKHALLSLVIAHSKVRLAKIRALKFYGPAVCRIKKHSTNKVAINFYQLVIFCQFVNKQA